PPGVLKSCAWISSPSLDLKVTGSGEMSLDAGNEAGTCWVASIRGCPPATGITAGSGGCWVVEARKATNLLSAVTTGLHSRPAPRVIAAGGAEPSTGTLNT